MESEPTPETFNAYDKRLAREYVEALERGKEAYEEADAALSKLHERNDVGTKVPVVGDRKVELVDNFADGNVSWKPAGVRRLDAKIHKPRKKRSSKKKTS